MNGPACSQYVLKRNRVARADDAHPHPAVDTLLRRRHAYLQAHQADLFTVSLYLVVLVEPDRPATAWASQARRALRQPIATSREWFSTARTIVRLDADLDRRRRPAAPQGRRLRPAARGHGRAPPAVEGRGLHVLPASPELHAGEGGCASGSGRTPFSTTTPATPRSSVIGRTCASMTTTSACSRSRSRRRTRFRCCSRRCTRFRRISCS